MLSIYIDQNILVYLSEGKISLPTSDEYTWVYSDEHFAEIERSGRLNLLDSLEKIGARRIKIILDDKFKITNEVRLEDFKSASESYNEYISNKKGFSNVNLDFIPLLSFFSGSKDAIQIDKVSENFVSGIKDLMSDIFEDLNCEEQKNILMNSVSLIGENLQSTLSEASKNLKPIQELRQSLAGSDLSNLNNTKGLIIDQIWEIIFNKYPEISKDQFFGKKPFNQPGFDEEFPLLLSIAQCYSALNFVGYWPDRKMSQISKINGINSDASHVGHAAFCHVLLSEDIRLCKKASAIYQFFNINTAVCPIEIDKILNEKIRDGE
jgi:hypothetical protein